jgi:hypothetical protein
MPVSSHGWVLSTFVSVLVLRSLRHPSTLIETSLLTATLTYEPIEFLLFESGLSVMKHSLKVLFHYLLKKPSGYFEAPD